MEDRIGTCSLCEGPVVVPATMVNPTPHCVNCGAIARQPRLPVIPMERRPAPPRPPYMEDIDPDFGDVQWRRYMRQWNVDEA